MTLTDQVIKNIIKHIVKGEDYRIEVITLIDADFLQFAIDFFKKVTEAKLKDQVITIDWYKSAFLNPKLKPNDVAINSGLNKKTIVNMFNSGTRKIVLEASNDHYDVLYQSISTLIENQPDIDLSLTIKFRGVSVDLNINESLIVINTLAVKRAALRGGLWSTAGKRVEKYLMITLCKIFEVPFENYDQKSNPKSKREVDFYLIKDGKYHRCEVKLMGKGNPESADAIFARETNVFIADKLSDLNKYDAERLKINWVELRSENGYKRFATILKALDIPHSDFQDNLDEKLDVILTTLIDSKKTK